jgi:hypothetical protein
MTTEPTEVLVVDRSSGLPTFCALAYQGENPAVVTWIDFWAVEPCSSVEADYVRGQGYADEAIWHVQSTGQLVFIECVLMFIGMKLREKDRCAGGLEQGFIDRIAGHFPGAMDNVLMRIFRRHPKMLN